MTEEDRELAERMQGQIIGEINQIRANATYFGNQPLEMHLDVTSAVNSAIAASDQYLGFRLSTTMADRFNIGSVSSLPNPVLTIPEPGTIALLGLGGILLRKRKKD